MLFFLIVRARSGQLHVVLERKHAVDEQLCGAGVMQRGRGVGSDEKFLLRQLYSVDFVPTQASSHEGGGRGRGRSRGR